jgi:hypothetical protein
VTDSNWEPKPSERVYYRSKLDGQRAYIVRKDGFEMLRLDRPSEEIYRKLNAEWVPDKRIYSANPHQVAKVAFIADRALCAVVGDFLESKQEWLNLREAERIRFMQLGPNVGGIRDKLFKAVMKTLKELTDG